MNAAVMFSSETDMWETPQEFYDELNKEFKFQIDVCATEENRKCANWLGYSSGGVFTNGLTHDWGKQTCWMNPPYGREIGKWVEKAYEQSREGAVVVCLLPSRTDTKWFHDYIYYKAKEIRFVKGRLKFGCSKNSAPFPSMVVVFGNY